MKHLLLPVLLCCASACRAPGEATADQGSSFQLQSQPEAISLLGRTLRRVVDDPEQASAQDAKVEEARQLTLDQAACEQDWIVYGRRLSAAGRYREAWLAFEQGRWGQEGQQQPAESWRLLRYQGHRSITLRRFAEAEQLLERATQLSKGAALEFELRMSSDIAAAHPVSYQHNIAYHLGVARHLQQDFAGASEAWAAALALADNPDMLCGATHWAYMALRRQGLDAQAQALLAPISAELDVRESTSYYRLCQFYQGRISAAELLPASETDPLQRATLGYGLANWYWCEGQRDLAIALWREVAESPTWMAFGCIASEAELVRL